MSSPRNCLECKHLDFDDHRSYESCSIDAEASCAKGLIPKGALAAVAEPSFKTPKQRYRASCWLDTAQGCPEYEPEEWVSENQEGRP